MLTARLVHSMPARRALCAPGSIDVLSSSDVPQCPATGVKAGVHSMMADLDAHGARTAWLAAHLCERLGVSPITARAIGQAARTHDIGKTFLPEALLDKPAELTRDERAQIERHCTLGACALMGPHDHHTTNLTGDALVALLHHEWWNGQGYPFGLSKDEIPRSARIVAVADVFDALLVARPYKPAWPQDRALDHIWRHRGTQFDPECVEALMEVAPSLPRGWLAALPRTAMLSAGTAIPVLFPG